MKLEINVNPEELFNNRIKRLDENLRRLKEKKTEIENLINRMELEKSKNQDIDSWLISTIHGDLDLIEKSKRPGRINRYDKIRYEILRVDLERLWDFVHNFTNRYDSIQSEFDQLSNEVDFNLDHEEFEKAEENSKKLVELCESVLLRNS